MQQIYNYCIKLCYVLVKFSAKWNEVWKLIKYVRKLSKLKTTCVVKLQNMVLFTFKIYEESFIFLFYVVFPTAKLCSHVC